MIDLHTHILPGIDDGPGDEAAAVELARAAADTGATAVVATPHIDHVHRVDPRSLPARVERLTALLEQAGIPLTIHQGGEIAPTRVDELSDEELGLVRLGGGPYVLLECPFTDLGDGFATLALRVQSRGHRVVLAHPERSPVFLARRHSLEQLVAQGAAVQITADSIAGRFGRRVQSFSFELLAHGLVHAIASDAHAARGRAPGAEHARIAAQRALHDVDRHWSWWTREAPAALLDGTALAPPPRAPREARGPLRRLRRR